MFCDLLKSINITLQHLNDVVDEMYTGIVTFFVQVHLLLERLGTEEWEESLLSPLTDINRSF